MKKVFFLFFAVTLVITSSVYSEETPVAVEEASGGAVETVDAAAAVVTEQPVINAPVTPTQEIPAAPITSADSLATETLSDNLEFISGEISALDEAGKTVSVKLYGEDEAAKTDKTLSVTIDDNTDITDGEQDRALKSLTVGTEVDVEYDPASNKATYIFVY